MRWPGIVVGLVVGIVVLLAYTTITHTPGAVPVYVMHNASTQGISALYSKNVSATTPYIIVDLYSGEKDDPLTLTIITPSRVLGPFTDASDGVIDGRIVLKISRSGGLEPGVWKFRIQSSRQIALGNVDTKLNSS